MLETIPARGELNILDTTGHTRIIWDSASEDEVDAARATFDKLKAKGYQAFSVKKDGEQGEKINTFDPKAEKIILAPPLRGG